MLEDGRGRDHDGPLPSVLSHIHPGDKGSVWPQYRHGLKGCGAPQFGHSLSDGAGGAGFGVAGRCSLWRSPPRGLVTADTLYPIARRMASTSSGALARTDDREMCNASRPGTRPSPPASRALCSRRAQAPRRARVPSRRLVSVDLCLHGFSNFVRVGRKQRVLGCG